MAVAVILGGLISLTSAKLRIWPAAAIPIPNNNRNTHTHDDEIVDWTAIPPRDYEASTQACLLYRTGWILSVPAIAILQLINWRYLNNGIILLDSELHFARSITST